MESSNRHLSVFFLAATATRTARSTGALVVITLLAIIILHLLCQVASYFLGLNLFLWSCQLLNRDKPLTNAASGIVNDNRT